MIIDLDDDDYEFVVRATALLADAERQSGADANGRSAMRRLLQGQHARGGCYVFVYPEQRAAVEAVLRGDHAIPDYPKAVEYDGSAAERMMKAAAA